MGQLVVKSSADRYASSNNATYSTARVKTSADALYASTDDALYVGQYKNLTDPYYLWRTFLYFDTSNGGANPLVNSIITSATVSLYGYRNLATTSFDIVIQSGQPTYPSEPIDYPDYNYLYYQGSSNGGQISTVGLNTEYDTPPGGFNDIVLNGNGLKWINKTGTTKFCLRSSKDIAGTTPTTVDEIWFYSSHKGEAYAPYLTVNYSPNPSQVLSAGSITA